MSNTRVVNLPNHLVPVGAHQTLAVPATAGDVSAITGYARPAGSTYVSVQCEAGAAIVRTTSDGATAPVAGTTGFVWADKSVRSMRSEEWAKTKVLGSTTGAVFQVQHYRV